MTSGVRVAWALVMLVVAAAYGCGKSDAQSPASPPRPASAAIKPLPVTIARAEAREVQRAVETIGSLVAWDDVQVKTEQPGTIARLLVDLGDPVTRGKVLAEYDAREFELAVQQAQADLLSAKQSLARARATVHSSEAALRRAKDNLVTLEAEVARTQSEVDWARSELERSQELFRKQFIAARDIDSARNLHNVAAARLAGAVAARDQHPDQVRIAEAQLESDRAALLVAEAEVSRREPTLGIAQKRLGDTTIRAPFAGVVAKRHVNAGEYVKENTPVFTVVALDPLKYTGTVPERFAPDLKTNQRLDLSVEAYPGRSFAGHVTRVSPAVEVQTRSLVLEGRVANGDGRLRPGFFAKGAVLTKKDGAVPFVPAEAVFYFVGISKVFVVGDGKVEERLVRAGARQGAWIEIIEGVKPGETVAVSNLAQLFNGAPVTVLESKIVK
ncbi:MAG TPA: efflux RND transporter periplasmic adaptor subunit [Methylomirabilota bacterium]|jgi:RND family efflux transporter MFP subunit|nr:efflux RND transporter periplasmic adaptor subunit [Methylomirabilota bacterium]